MLEHATLADLCLRDKLDSAHCRTGFICAHFEVKLDHYKRDSRSAVCMKNKGCHIWLLCNVRILDFSATKHRVKLLLQCSIPSSFVGLGVGASSERDLLLDNDGVIVIPKVDTLSGGSGRLRLSILIIGGALITIRLIHAVKHTGGGGKVGVGRAITLSSGGGSLENHSVLGWLHLHDELSELDGPGDDGTLTLPVLGIIALVSAIIKRVSKAGGSIIVLVLNLN